MITGNYSHISISNIFLKSLTILQLEKAFNLDFRFQKWLRRCYLLLNFVKQNKDYIPFYSRNTGGRCLSGTFCAPGSSHPEPCTPGFYCSRDELDKVSGPCARGYFCSGSSKEERPVNQTYGDICPAGSFCLVASNAPNACREGYFARGEGNDISGACQLCK